MPGDLIQTPQTLWKLGSYESVQRPNIITLNGQIGNGAAEARYTQLLVPGGAAGYQVPTGKTLFITHLRCISNLAATLWHFGSATADPGNNQIAAPAGAIPFDAIALGAPSPLILQIADLSYEFTTALTVSSDRFPYFRCFAAPSFFRITLQGHEK